MPQQLSIGIIGGGASGTALLIQLLERLQSAATIFLIEKQADQLHKGVAYSSSLSYEPLNVPTGKMSLYPDRPTDFYDWLVEHKPTRPITPDSFVSRRWFGEYVQMRLEQAMTGKSAAVDVQIIQSATIDVVTVGEQYQLQQVDGQTLVVDVVVLATGNETPGHVFSTETRQQLGAQYIGNPWTSNPPATIAVADTVLFIGTGLTTVDHIISLTDAGHSGLMIALSHHGQFPMVHAHTQSYELSQALSTETAEAMMAGVEAEIDRATAQGADWRSVFDALRPITPQLWRALSTAAKQQFLQHYRHDWDIRRHRMPQESAQKLDQLQASRRLQTLAGSVEGARMMDGRIQVQYRDRETQESKAVVVDWVVNCTGPSGDYKKTDNVLFHRLLERGLMRADELGLGIVTGEQGEILTAEGTPMPHWYAIGPVRRASEWESTAMREIREQAVEVADSILQMSAID